MLKFSLDPQTGERIAVRVRCTCDWRQADQQMLHAFQACNCPEERLERRRYIDYDRGLEQFFV